MSEAASAPSAPAIAQPRGTSSGSEPPPTSGARWRERSASDHPAALRERQRAHRLRALRPRELPEASSDPLELGYQALRHLKQLRLFMGAKPIGRHHLEEVEELIKQLSWGPGEDGDGRIPVKESPGRKPRRRRVASRPFACRVCGDKFEAIREAMYCSGACNQAAYRERKRGPED